MSYSKVIGIILSVFFPILFFFTPSPQGLTPQAWYYLGIFLVVILGLILEPVPSALIGLMGVCSIALLGLRGATPMENTLWALSGFSNPIIWLILSIFIFSIGYKKTGLGRRISLLLIKYLGKNSLGLGYAIAFADISLALFVPSNTARSGGILYPIVINIPTIFHSSPAHERRKIGAYVTWVSVCSMCVTSSMFFTILAPHLLLASAALNEVDIVISWDIWVDISLRLLVPLFLLIPLLVYIIYPPTQKVVPQATAWASLELERMGRIRFKEVLMALFALITLMIWIFAKKIGIDITIAVISMIILMIVLGLITWDDVIQNPPAWNIFIWFSTLVTLSSGLHHMKLTEWMGANMEVCLASLSQHMVMVVMVITFFLLHYFFASLIAHVSVLLPLFVFMASKFLTYDQLTFFVVLLSSTIGLMGVLTPYSTGASPIWYSAGYVSQKEWWRLGAIFGLIFMSVSVLGIYIFT